MYIAAVLVLQNTAVAPFFADAMAYRTHTHFGPIVSMTPSDFAFNTTLFHIGSVLLRNATAFSIHWHSF